MTEEQQKAIDTIDRAVIISANAGSGKTSTMVKRLISIIDKGIADVSQILALTFTNSAATEMKQRLAFELQELLNKNLDRKKEIEKQIAELNVADISSLDSFCQKVIKKYFYIIDIDPNFNIIDEVEAGYLKSNALETTLIEYADTLPFRDLTQSLKDIKKFDHITELIYKFSEFLFTLVDYKKYLEEVKDTEKLYKKVCDYTSKRFIDMIGYYKDKFDYYHEIILSQDYELLKGNCELAFKFIHLFDDFTFDKLKNLSAMPEFLPFSRVKKGREDDELELQEEMKNVVNAFKEDMSEYLQVFCYGNLNDVQRHFDKSNENVKFIIELTTSFIDKYNELKANRNVLDFTDLEDKAIEILQNTTVQNEIKNNYKFVCVDEFQDTNEKQSALLDTICGQTNTFFVGDPKQSIYNFRQCDLNIFVQLIDEFKLDKSKLALSFNQNFRSHKKILEFVNDVFDKIMTKNVANIDYKGENRFENLKELRLKYKGEIGKAKKVNNIDRVKIFVLDKECQGLYFDKPLIKDKILKFAKCKNLKYRTHKHYNVYSVLNDQNRTIKYQETTEGQIAVQYILNFFDKKIRIRDPETKQKRPVKFSDFVILLRSRKDFQMYIDALKEYSIPVSAKFKFNLIELPHIQMLVNLLKCVNNPKDDLPIATALKLICKLNDIQMYRIRERQKDGFFYQAVKNFEPEDEKDIELKEKLQIFENKLKEYTILARNFNVSKLLSHIIYENDLYNYFLVEEDGIDKVEQINLFLSKMENKSFDENLNEFLQFIDNYKKAFEVDFSTVASDNSVKITTIHDSKGLEFPITIVGGCGNTFNLSKQTDFVYSKELGVGGLDVDLVKRVKYPTISHSAIFTQKQVEEILEEMRILYVALTRPKEYLALIGKERTTKFDNLDEYTILKCRSFFDFILN